MAATGPALSFQSLCWGNTGDSARRLAEAQATPVDALSTVTPSMGLARSPACKAQMTAPSVVQQVCRALRWQPRIGG